ncbi:hypothetical protein FA95DRAFT_1552561 [Auriscalpium vulgare]|uniref:Uncharacterized protein n=1 Tax=Auriscalpium vulgare TaxID=40419 RepID=A0ACB8SC68_9AGAM|nr:hypothetical protein FA95DRAFT_1552561 [Auriscalpium vulgare]
MAPMRSSRKPTRATDDIWLHDKAPGQRAIRPSRPVPIHASAANGSSLSSKLSVANLHYEITQKDLTVIFGRMGTLVREPLIRFDRSGRSLGTAIITFETSAEATRAKQELNGILAKGQPMAVEYEVEIAPRRASAPASLLNRIQKAPLISRLGQAENDAKASLVAKNRKAEVARGGTGGLGRGRGSRAVPSERRSKKPKTADELNAEIDAFMADGSGAAKPSVSNGTAATSAASTAGGGEDVEMA